MECKHFFSSTKVAIKERLCDDELSVRQWKKEISILRRIETEIPSLTTSRLICVLNDSPNKIPKKYMVMEFINGQNLTKIKPLFAKMNEKEKLKNVIRIFLILSNELQKMHQSNFIHRDIKLENTMFFEKEDKLYFIFIDFGSSFKLSDKEEEKVYCISPPYSPPEQNTAEESFLSDVYSLGICFEKILDLIEIFDPPLSISSLVVKMREKQISERISLEECKKILINFVSDNFKEDSDFQGDYLKQKCITDNLENLRNKITKKSVALQIITTKFSII